MPMYLAEKKTDGSSLCFDIEADTLEEAAAKAALQGLTLLGEIVGESDWIVQLADGRRVCRRCAHVIPKR